MLLLGHRGYSAKAPENTKASFELGLEHGVDGFELDLQLTKDGEFVIVHDDTIDRTSNGKGFVGQYTLAELKEFDAGSWFDPKFAGEKILSFREFCELIKDHDLFINLELKVTLGFEKYNQALLKVLDEYGLGEKLVVSSFNHFAIAHLKQLRPELTTGILYTCAMVNPWVYAKSIGAEALHPYYLSVIPEIVQGAKANGMQVNTWTVNDRVAMERMITAGVDSIMTDNISVLKDVLGRK